MMPDAPCPGQQTGSAVPTCACGRQGSFARQQSRAGCSLLLLLLLLLQFPVHPQLPMSQGCEHPPGNTA